MNMTELSALIILTSLITLSAIIFIIVIIVKDFKIRQKNIKITQNRNSSEFNDIISVRNVLSGSDRHIDTETVAVIASAVWMYFQNHGVNYKIKKINKFPDATPPEISSARKNAGPVENIIT